MLPAKPMASEARVGEQEAEKEAFRKYHSEFPWLKLTEHQGKHALGCRLCMSTKAARSSKDKFINGSYVSYVLGKYFYRRTLQNHETCAAHQKAKNSQPTDVSNDAVVSTPERAVRRSGSSSLASSPVTPGTGSKQGSPRPQSRRAYLFNQALTMYTALCIFGACPLGRWPFTWHDK